MEATLRDREFYATFGGVSVQEARVLFADYYGRVPEVVQSVGDRLVAGPVTKEEVRQETHIRLGV